MLSTTSQVLCTGGTGHHHQYHHHNHNHQHYRHSSGTRPVSSQVYLQRSGTTTIPNSTNLTTEEDQQYTAGLTHSTSEPLELNHITFSSNSLPRAVSTSKSKTSIFQKNTFSSLPREINSSKAKPHKGTYSSLPREITFSKTRTSDNWLLSTPDKYKVKRAQSVGGTLRRKPDGLTPVGTLRRRPHSTGTIIKRGAAPQDRVSKQVIPIGGSGGAGGEVLLLYRPPQRHISRPLQGRQNIDMAISNFHIKFDGKDSFKPGDEISGKVIMDVWSSIHIQFVEFVIQGKGTVRVFKDSSTFLERPRNEVYLEKKILLIGPQNGHPQGHGVTLNPGRFISNFRYTLPESLPPTVHQFDMGHGYIFDISYSVQAHVCDKVRSRHIHNTATAIAASSGKVVRIVKAAKKKFTMTALKDWQSIPGAMEPIFHAEQLQLFCSRSSKDPTSVLFNLNRAVYPIGDNIKLNIEVFHPKKRKVKNIEAELEQQIIFSKDAIRKFRRVLIRAIDNQTMRHTTDHENMIRSKFSIPVPSNLVPSYLPYCRMLDITYTMKVTINFRHFGGKLTVRLPVIVAPASDADRNIDSTEVPVFNKPIMQFPYFSKSPIIPDMNGFATLGGRSTGTESGRGTMRSNHMTTLTSNGTLRGSHNKLMSNGVPAGKKHSKRSDAYKDRHREKNDKVTIKYKPGINCCSCCVSCFGYGIYDS